MKKILLLLLVFSSPHAIAQDYNCFVPGAYQYFINSIYYSSFFSLNGGYLRGMHIDSIRQDSNKTIYYPFHTVRGLYGDQLPPLDTNGGSWLGKAVVQLQDGTFQFGNYWGDTVVIKTHANVGDTWMFYSDSTSQYFTASVIGMDTMTILGTLDSIKTITVTEIDSGIINTANPTNIILSKAHGFAQVFDLYMFPFHLADTLFAPWNFDYFTHCSLQAGSLLFKQIDFHNPTSSEINNHNIGDVFEGHVSEYSEINYLDTVVDKIVYPNFVEYIFHTWRVYVDNPIGVVYAPAFSVDTLTVSNIEILDSTFMPESFSSQPIIVEYWPGDTSLCFKSDAFWITSSNIIRYANGFQLAPLMGYCPLDYAFKEGLGDQLYYGLYYQTNCVYDYSHESQLFYAYKQGIGGCGQYQDILSVSNISSTALFDIYPNPAFEDVTVKIKQGFTYSIAVVNSIGQLLYSNPWCNGIDHIDVRNFTPGVYFIRISDESGHSDNRKFVVQH
ncbi:MAG: T9SS type A sorting domain-containing protein [Flavipsychrobacter sp.]|nr:T9SS type A sorting domain-containing protein [Flavipsychrobacter sp.]